MSDTSLPRFLTIPELAEVARASEQTVRGWRAQGKGPRVTKVGGRVLFARDDVEAWLAEQAEAPSADATR